MRDVVIVGAGPAGTATATFLARHGVDVLLLERSGFPRNKPCGDCLSPGANAVLERLGVLDEIRSLAPARLAGWRLRSPAGAVFTGRFGGGATGLALPRRELDAALLRTARAAGAEVRTGVRVRDLLRSGDAIAGVVAVAADGAPLRIPARLTIGADGLRSVVVRRLGLVRRPPRLRKASFTSHVRGVSCDPGWGEFHIGRGVLAGLAPVGDNAAGDPIANLTVVVPAARIGRPPRRNARDLFMRFAAELVGLRARIHSADVGTVLASGPFDWPVRRPTLAGAALVGDAAGYYDPLTGQGIFQALAGAEILAEEAARALGAFRAATHRLDRYAIRHRSLTIAARRLQWALEQVVSRPYLADRAFAWLAARPAAADELVRVTGDLRPAGGLLSPRLLFSFAGGRPAGDGEIV